MASTTILKQVSPLAISHKGSLPPTPPDTVRSNSSDQASNADDDDVPLPPSSLAPTTVLDIDKKTPDNHVARDPRLIRLTGVHPFNVEAPLSALFAEGFLTSPELFYVRNHGAVPQVHDADIEDWEVKIEGLVEKPFTFTLRELMTEYDQVTYPITLVCAGNRRKEQNVVRKTKGFSWGAAGVSTALFTGVPLADVLRRAKPLRQAKFVCMAGADKLPNGFYTTNVKVNWAMDANKGIMLAYKMNGEILRPDHGKPLRVVVPGQIGGRSVKWLRTLTLTAEPSDNYYHVYDNRVLPTMVSPEQSGAEPHWWHDERYAIYDLSPNSAIAHPAHDERLPLNPSQTSSDLAHATSTSTYRAQGYAYSGGGRRVTRVEVSLDQGKSWRLAEIDYGEDRYRDAADKMMYGGKIEMAWREGSFCWCFWALEIPLSDMVDAKDLLVRAMDEGMCLQPRDMYWSVLGMMNNPWFRVVIHREGDNLRFEHPTQPALIPGGWMERIKKTGGNLTNGRWGEKGVGEEAEETNQEPAAEVVMTQSGLAREISLAELREHDSEAHPWFVVKGQVYDGRTFLDGHPGGAQSIISAAGMDSTDEFMAIHSENAKGMMPKYHIGTLDAASRKALAEGEESSADAAPREVFLHAKQWTPAKLSAKRSVSWDTRIFTYELQHSGQSLGLPTGQHLMMRLKDPRSGENVIRSYTPISETTDRGSVDVLIKIYFDAGEVAGGRMSQAMDKLAIGATVDFKGPIGKFEYLGRGSYALNGQARPVQRFLMICGGSGVTPIYQVFRAVMRDAADPTTCVVLNGNRKPEDILCKTELDGLVLEGAGRGKVIYTLTQGDAAWQGRTGRVDGMLVREHCAPCPETVVLLCGPTALEKAMHQSLLADGWAEDQMVFF